MADPAVFVVACAADSDDEIEEADIAPEEMPPPFDSVVAEAQSAALSANGAGSVTGSTSASAGHLPPEEKEVWIALGHVLHNNAIALQN